ncbi:DNA-binding transcriptional ArsR family regulator [Hamadaea flava]|uniref:ArsR/SmtB family transcription factor n=1 Tax=Hamadaea flava TaxID=1742688 RepID=A0ABV8LRT3_9ACTN|nr:helix-turn-helix transcriptional regulator [Hamadaea flava]MCP2321762.1 DNA-binding transcriptional ArsR family regulator [Hamadaea flava]
MTSAVHPDEPALTEVPVTAVLFALSDPVRLQIVQTLSGGHEYACGHLFPDMPKATRSHHLKVLREAGLTTTRREGTSKFVRLRAGEVAERFPGLLDAVLPDPADALPAAPDPAR